MIKHSYPRINHFYLKIAALKLAKSSLCRRFKTINKSMVLFNNIVEMFNSRIKKTKASLTPYAVEPVNFSLYDRGFDKFLSYIIIVPATATFKLFSDLNFTR
jgi:hypothetical protein